MAKSKTPPRQYEPKFLQSLDRRSAAYAVLSSRYAEIVSDLGGEDGLSYLQRSLVVRYLHAEWWIEQQEIAITQGEAVDIGKLVQASNNIVGLSSKLGLERRAKDVPNLADYLAAKGGSQ